MQETLLYLSILLLVIFFVSSFFSYFRDFIVKYFISIAIITVSLILIAATILSKNIYLDWLSHPFTANFLPPYSEINYFLSFIYYKFYLPYFVSFVFALIFYIFSRTSNNYFANLFYREEYCYMFISLFLVPFPLILYYLILLIASLILIQLYNLVIYRKNEKVSFYYLWFPIAVCVILMYMIIPQYIFLYNLGRIS